MSNEIHLAFAHPKERSEASETGSVHDRISLRDHIVDVEIGAFQSEREQYDLLVKFDHELSLFH
jgi:dihydroneopterin aldolase